MIKHLRLIACLLVLSAFGANAQEQPVFKSLTAEETGIEFGNYIPKNHYMYAVTDDYLVSGCGLVVADFNKDGLQDVVCANNVGKISLFINQREFEIRRSKIIQASPQATGLLA